MNPVLIPFTPVAHDKQLQLHSMLQSEPTPVQTQEISSEITQFLEDDLQLYSEREGDSTSQCSAPVSRQCEVMCPFP